jgi:hypothetical protein
VAGILKVPPKSVTVAPHCWLNRMRPLWVGKRRWGQSRKQYKKLINASAELRAEAIKKKIQEKLEIGHKAEARAVAKVK